MRWFLLMIIAALLFASPASLGDSIIVNIREEGKVTSYYDEYYVVRVDGILTIYNPFNYSVDYIQLPYDISTLSIMDLSDVDHIGPLTISVPFLDANQEIVIPYQIRGITATDPMYNNLSILRTGFLGQQPSLYPPLFQNLKKAPVENQSMDNEKVVSVEKRRLIAVSVENPSGSEVNISRISVIKTPSDDPNSELSRWDFPESESTIIIDPGDIWARDIIDYNSSEGEVYWLSVGLIPFVTPYFNDSHAILRFTQDDVLDVENSSVYENETEWNHTSFIEHYMYLKKTVSKTLFNPEDTVEVRIRVNNFAPITRHVNLTDMIPFGFEIVDGDGNDFNSTDGNVVFWSALVNPDSSRVFSYRLRYSDNESLGIDYFDSAKLDYDNETMYSTRIPFVRQYVPEKKIYIQKTLSYGLDDEVKVRLQIQNLGEDLIKNLYLKEFLSSDDDFRELSQKPESKGVWSIPILKKDEIWEVTYVTNENQGINQLPEVYGVDKKVLMKTLIFENVIRNRWELYDISIVEYIGLGFIVLFPVLFIIFNRRRRYRKETALRSLGKQIHRLKEDTSPGSTASIGILKKEAGVKPSLPDTPVFDNARHNARHGHDSLRDLAHNNIKNLKKIDDETKGRKQD